MIFGMLATKISHFVMIGQKTWPPLLKIEHGDQTAVFIRPQNFCRRIMLWRCRRRCRRRLWKCGFRAITLVVVDRLL